MPFRIYKMRAFLVAVDHNNGLGKAHKIDEEANEKIVLFGARQSEIT